MMRKENQNHLSNILIKIVYKNKRQARGYSTVIACLFLLIQFFGNNSDLRIS